MNNYIITQTVTIHLMQKNCRTFETHSITYS